jgi:hypothetical protein
MFSSSLLIFSFSFFFLYLPISSPLKCYLYLTNASPQNPRHCFSTIRKFGTYGGPECPGKLVARRV